VSGFPQGGAGGGEVAFVRYPIWYPIFSATPLAFKKGHRLNCLVDKGFAQGN
jgi:hypothetical protein